MFQSGREFKNESSDNKDCSDSSDIKKSKNLSKMSDVQKQSHLFCKDVINNDFPALFYKIYDYNINKDGFKKQNNIFSDFANNSKKPGFITRRKNPIAIKITPNNKFN